LRLAESARGPTIVLRATFENRCKVIRSALIGGYGAVSKAVGMRLNDEGLQKDGEQGRRAGDP